MSYLTRKAAMPSLMGRVDGVGHWLAPFGLRVLLAWEFFDAGREKLLGENWFADLGDKFPLPFSLLGANVNWTLSTWLELGGSIALLLGLGTRYVASALFVLTVVAIYAVHWPGDWANLAELAKGYAITNDGFGNYKLPLIYLVMLLPLMLNGSGRLSVDHLVQSVLRPIAPSTADRNAWGVVLLGLGLTLSLLLPWFGGALALAGLGLVLAPRRSPRPAGRLASA